MEKVILCRAVKVGFVLEQDATCKTARSINFSVEEFAPTLAKSHQISFGQQLISVSMSKQLCTHSS